MSTELHLRPYQGECLTSVWGAWDRGVQRPAVVLPTGSGKGHPLDTEVPTPGGIRKWGDLEPGDQVYGSDGQPTQITAVYDRGILPAYRVTFGDGASVITDAEHLWTVTDHMYRRTSRERRTLSTADMAAEGLRHGRSHRFAVPVSGVRRPDTELPVGPYTLGSLIANGYLVASPVLTTPDEHVVNRVVAEGHRVTRHSVDEEKWCPRFSVLGTGKYVRALGLDVKSAEKFIPRQYLEAGTGQRLALLQGLMDGDGSSRPERRSVIYATTSPRLADDMVELVCSLGGTASISTAERVQPSSGKTYQDIGVHILMPPGVEALSTPRKDRGTAPRRVFEPRRAVVSVERVEDQEIRCIRVAAEDSLYQVTRHHIVTHNTVIFAHLARQFIELARLSGTPQRVVVLVHRDELADQAIDKIRSVAPDLQIGKVKADDDDITADVMVCSVQTLARDWRLERLILAEVDYQISGIGLVIVDEAHHAAASSYQKIMQALGCFSGAAGGFSGATDGTRCLGVTATMARGDGVGLGDTWQEIVFSRSVLWMISRGFLTDVRGKAVDLDDLHLGDVKKSGGDYQAKALGQAIIAARGPEIVARALLTYAADRRPIVFLPDVASAHATTLALTSAGIPAATVDGATPRADRLEIYRRYRTGELRAIVNCMVLTEGADFPWADCVVNARPTTNPVLYIQMIGRGLRPWPGKTDCLVLDVTGTGGRLSTLIDLAPGEVASFRDGESLADAAVREAAEGDVTVQAENLAFNLKHRDLDLFSSSGHAWLRTPAGVMFIPVANEEIFLWANDGLWDVCYAPPHAKWTRLHRGMQLGTAMAWAETEAEDRMPFNGTKSADWRRRRAEPRQVAMARSYRVDVGDDPRKGPLSDAISVAKASEKFDEWMRRAK